MNAASGLGHTCFARLGAWFAICPTLAVLLALSGCATILNGRTQIVGVRSTPPGATVRVQSVGDAEPASSEPPTTPCQLALSRKSSYVLRVEKAGYDPASAALEAKASSTMWRNLVWIHPVGWLIGLIVDMSTGAGYELRPNQVEVTLIPASYATGGAPRGVRGEAERP